MTKFFVIAGGFFEFKDWKSKNYPEMLLNHDIENVGDIIYVSGVHVLKGYSNPTGIFIGTWHRRVDIKEILIQLSTSMTDTNRVEGINRAWEHLKSIKTI